MKCQKCGAKIVLAKSKYCNECGSKIEPLKPTDPKRESFLGVGKIKVGLGTEIKINPSDNDVTTVIVEGPEEIKQDLTMRLRNGVLDIRAPSNSINISVDNISGGNINIAGGLFVGGSITGSNIYGNSISTGDDSSVSVIITTPRGVDVSIDVAGDLNCEIGDLQSDITVDTDGDLIFNAKRLTGFDAVVSGSLKASIDNFENGQCDLEVSGSCKLTIPSGNIEELVADVSGSASLQINAETNKAILDVSGDLRGNLRAHTVSRDVSGSDSLSVIR